MPNDRFGRIPVKAPTIDGPSGNRQHRAPRPETAKTEVHSSDVRSERPRVPEPLSQDRMSEAEVDEEQLVVDGLFDD